MDICVMYFSGTRNTELICRELKKALEERNNRVELISIEDVEALNLVDFSNKTIGFAYPVYKFTFPDNFLKLFEHFNRLAVQNNYFQLCTYARFTANVFSDFSKKLNKRNYKLIACKAFKSPSNGISARLPETDFEYKSVMFFEDDVQAKICAFADEIIANGLANVRLSMPKSGMLASLRLKIVKDIEQTKYPKLQIDAKTCIHCGLCAVKCPDANLVLTEDGIEIIDDKTCLHCLRCMHRCPSNSISFGKLSRGENRYTLNLRNELFRMSASGVKNEYWADFEKTRKEWRRNTLMYWRKHRRKPEI